MKRAFREKAVVLLLMSMATVLDKIDLAKSKRLSTTPSTVGFVLLPVSIATFLRCLPVNVSSARANMLVV